MKISSLAAAFFITLALSASESTRWSPWTYQDKREAKTLTLHFFSSFNQNKYHEIRKMIDPVEMNYGGSVWMSSPKFLYFIGNLREKGELRFDDIRAFTFDDCEADPGLKKYAMELYRVFDNRSIITISEVSFTGETAKTPGILLLRKNTNTGQWYIAAIAGFNARLETPSESRPGNDSDWREEEIRQFRMALSLPVSFREKSRYDKILEYRLPGEKEQDAALQIMAVRTSSPALETGYQFLEKILEGRRHTELRIKYLPYGYWFESEVLDRDKDENKCIVVSLRNRKYVVLISLISSIKAYEERWREMEYCLRNITLY